jgi:hypothetical protein
MHVFSDIGVVSHVVQLAVAPVFLLVAIASMLTLFTNRLSRIIDRSRVLVAKLESTPPGQVANLHAELVILSRRSKYIGMAITLCIITALLVCAVVVLLFLGNFFQFGIAIPIALLFITAMLLIVAALFIFLREILIATANLRIGPH